MPRPTLALVALLALSGCAELGYSSDGRWDRSRYPPTRRAPTYDGRADDYRRSHQYGRVRSDAANYAQYVDRNLRLGSGHEAAIRQIVERRAYDLLQRTRPRDHARVYPFPRQYGRHTSFWNGVDNEVERRLGSRQRDDYRYLVRYGEARYRDRHRGGSDYGDRRPGSGRSGSWGHDDGERGRVGDRWDRDDDDRRGRRDRDD